MWMYAQTRLTKLIVAFNICANMPKDVKLCKYETSYVSLLGMSFKFLNLLFMLLMLFYPLF